MTLIPGADPWSFDGDDVGVLVLHGFTGSPKSMRPWADDLAGHGWTVRMPLLPGHGTTWQDMNGTTWHDWYGEANTQLKELVERCQHVFICGLSMGGSLALRLAEEHGDGIRGIVVVNPAVHTERPDRFLLPFIYRFVGAFPGISNDIAKPGQDEGCYDKIPLRAAHSMQQMWKQIRADIAKVTQPILLFRSLQDHVVEASNAEWILTNVSSADRAEVLLPDSFHVATLDHDADLIFHDSAAFIKRLTP